MDLPTTVTRSDSQVNSLDARLLVSRLASKLSQPYGLGSMSISIYDTAWVAMVSRTTGSTSEFLFPESFQYLLQSQSPDGSWEVYASQVDGILNTAAGLLALIKHQIAEPLLCDSNLPTEINYRINKAQESLGKQLQGWNLEICDHVGFEILVPALLDMLEAEGLKLDFPARSSLMEINNEKLCRFNSEVLYGPHQTTMLHSLEAFIGKIEFDRVSHHKVHGSLLASPSSTAAYLMNCQIWDEDAEAYLRRTVAGGTGSGGVPCAFPTTNFEITWVSKSAASLHLVN